MLKFYKTTAVEKKLKKAKTITENSWIDMVSPDKEEIEQVVKITGIDVLVRNDTYIPVEKYDGYHINKSNNSVPATMMIDVLHHTEKPELVLKEAVRVSKVGIKLFFL